MARTFKIRKKDNRKFKRIRSRSPRKIASDRIYAKVRIKWLEANPWCEWGKLQNPPRQIPATDIHHKRGKVGSLLCDTTHFCSVSREGHIWIDANRAAAAELGLLDLKNWGRA